ncbi:hypothetical protein HDU93_006502, partial [Gonapodya sp. JEL0774]
MLLANALRAMKLSKVIDFLYINLFIADLILSSSLFVGAAAMVSNSWNRFTCDVTGAVTQGSGGAAIWIMALM